MRVLLDENLPRRLLRLFPPGMGVSTVARRGWGGKKNGELLNLAQQEFDVFVTNDHSIPHQRNLARFALVVLQARSNDYDGVPPLVMEALRAFPALRPGSVVRIEAPDPA